MKNILNVAILAVIAPLTLGCGISKYLNTTTNTEANRVASTPSAAPTTNSSPFPTPSPKPAQPAFIDTLKKSAGKYPYEIKLLENKQLQARLKSLLGTDFAEMKQNWNVETPIVIQDGILMTTGCEQHNCGSNRYFLFIDLGKDNINVFHVEDEKTNNYFEKGRISLPAKFADELGNQ